MTNAADIVIIAPTVFGQYAQTLANMRIQHRLNTKAVTTDDIFDEFGYGARSAQSIKDFLRHATSYWQVKPKYVLLFGDIVRLAKLNSPDADSRRTYQLFGDPTVFIK
ncbi:hypothetical protein BH20ACI4_BH20ACI4_17030 [soil metagenome]